MYYPYLRGKQFELIALREFSEAYPQSHKIVPIIEPVKTPLASLRRALETLEKNNLSCFVILNPNAGDFAHINAGDSIFQQCNGIASFNPAFLCDNYNIDNLSDYINQWHLSNVMIVFKDDINSTDSKVISFLNSDKIQYVVGEFGRSLKKHLIEADKKLITFGDYFNNRNANAEYDKCPDEKYSEEHTFYVEDKYYGFSDYCVLPKNMPDGGMIPAAVAIHLTYKKNDEEIWVHHYVSDTQHGRQNIQAKFKEAALKVKDDYEQNILPDTFAIRSLITNLEEEKFPGLGVLKKYSILNHLELLNAIL